MMFRRFLVVLILILAFALVACGGGDEPAASDQPDEAGSAAEPATATAEPPTATPVEPTATPEPTPTLAPTPTEVAEELTPEGDQVSAGEGDVGSGAGNAGAGSGWGASGSGAQSACDHPYLPLRPGASWTYEGSEGQIVWEVTDVQGGMDEATAVINVTVGDVSLTYQWQCKAGRGLSSFDFANLSSVPVGLDMTIEQVSVDGQFLLPPEQMIVGASWAAELQGAIYFSQEIEGTTLEATGDMKNMQQHTIMSADPVEVGGQSVPGLQLEQNNNIAMAISLMGTSTEQTINLSNTFDLGYGIGMVSQSSVTDFGTETMTLVAYSIP